MFPEFIDFRKKKKNYFTWKKLPRKRIVFGDETLTKTAVYDRFKRFKKWSRIAYCRRIPPEWSTSNNDESTEKVQNSVRSDRRRRVVGYAHVPEESSYRFMTV